MIINFHTDFLSLGCLHPGAFSYGRNQFSLPQTHSFLLCSTRDSSSLNLSGFLLFGRICLHCVLSVGEAGRGSQAIAGVADKCPKGTAFSKSAKYTKGKPQLNRRRCQVLFLARRCQAFACTAEGPAFFRAFFSVSAAILSTLSAADRQRPEGGVELESNPARDAANLHIVQIDLATRDALRTTTYRLVGIPVGLTL
jgi:hypothetical protein